MQTRHLSFLTVGYNPKEFQDFEIHFAESLDEAEEITKVFSFDVVIISQDFFDALGDKSVTELNFLKFCTKKILLLNEDTEVESIKFIQNKYQFDKIVFTNDSNKFDIFINTLQESKNLNQQIEMEKMLLERSEKLVKIQKELELKIEKRNKSLKESRRKLFNTNNRVETYKLVLYEVFKLNSIAEIENTLNQILVKKLNLTWVKIIFDKQLNAESTQINDELNYRILEIPITNYNDEVGFLYFMRDKHMTFRRDEIDFFNRISEAVSLAVQRIFLFEESEKAHHQWMTTFQSIPAPFLIIDSKLNVIQSNFKSVNKFQTKCYQQIFHRDTRCEKCQIGTNFQISNYEVYGQEIQLEKENEKYFVHLYHNVEEKMKYEKRLLESARSSEIGVIGSSIAHELNNPLAGMLSFTQIAQMDLEPSHNLFRDLQTIEQSILKCRDIVQNLLNFSRDTATLNNEDFYLIKAFQHAIELSQLLNKNLMVRINLLQSDHFRNIQIFGNYNLTVQAIKHVLQYFIEEIQNQNFNVKPAEQELVIQLFESEIKAVSIHINSPSIPIQKPKHHLHLSLTIAGKICHDQGINLEWKLNSEYKLSAIFHISRPV